MLLNKISIWIFVDSLVAIYVFLNIVLLVMIDDVCYCWSIVVLLDLMLNSDVGVGDGDVSVVKDVGETRIKV